MKTVLKHVLAKFGLYSSVDQLRRLSQIVSWLRGGCKGIAPPPVKRMILSSYLKEYRLDQFIETGTHVGDTLAMIAVDKRINAVSIELDDNYYEAAVRRFSKWPNVTLLHGDSGILMPDLIRHLDQPTLFWLDGHYSGGLTAKGEQETPVSTELQTILQSPVSGHVILIDDIRCFDGTHDYPFIDELLNRVRADGRYKVEISADILRMTPTN